MIVLSCAVFSHVSAWDLDGFARFCAADTPTIPTPCASAHPRLSSPMSRNARAHNAISAPPADATSRPTRLRMCVGITRLVLHLFRRPALRQGQYPGREAPAPPGSRAPNSCPQSFATLQSVTIFTAALVLGLVL
ncbi:hypothetical protein B0H13DRAFT_73987 [Mycena leptocephala]|nr:hypothetical protein B0H13DRAFT_73987 [Mycena leptocephala]